MNHSEKFLFFPEAHSDKEIIGSSDNIISQMAHDDMPSDREAADTSARFPCPCCGYYTFPVDKSKAIAYICPVCFWENDVFTKSDDEPSDENRGMTLNEARAEYRRIGATRDEYLQFVRDPYPNEKR